MNPFAVFWMGLPKWAQQVLLALGLFIGFLIFGRLWLEAHDMQVRKKEQEKQRRRNAEMDAKVVTTITENSNELVRESERVRAHTATVELPDGTARLPDYHYRD